MSGFYLTGNVTADELLARDPNAVLLGMVLDQQVTMEKAFTGPAVIAERMGGQLDVAAIAAADPEEFAAMCAKPPAVHRFPGSMAGRVQGVCQVLVRDWDGEASKLYASAKTGQELKALIASLPGFGEQKASIFVALLGKRFGVTPPGWDTAAGGYGRAGTYVSVADIVDVESLQLVREAKRLAKANAKAKAAKAAKA
ncbi:MAG: Fe-S cluster assembly protein HesB [Actinomycetota bacterium]|nr:Fe-S cluster assembly protein HesB [Actinomycetota bacterium]